MSQIDNAINLTWYLFKEVSVVIVYIIREDGYYEDKLTLIKDILNHRCVLY